MMIQDETPVWETISASEVTEMDAIARAVHLDLPERPEVFAEKIRLFPRGCRKLALDGKMVGYAIAHPWKLYSIPPLDDYLGGLPSEPECIYIHDVAVLPGARGTNAAGRFVQEIKALALSRSISFLTMVSVYGTYALWARFGFQVSLNHRIQPKLGSYGPTAQYMIARF